MCELLLFMNFFARFELLLVAGREIEQMRDMSRPSLIITVIDHAASPIPLRAIIIYTRRYRNRY